MFRKICIVFVAFLPSATWSFNGRMERIEMEEQTQFELKVVPHLGTRLIFPFLLDDINLKPPLNYKLTNTLDFTVTYDLDVLAGQNVFLITCSENAGAIGKLYMSIAGYNLSINLNISPHLQDHVSDIFFDLGDGERNFLIAMETERIRQQLTDLYKKRYERNKARDTAHEDLGVIILRGARHRNIKRLYRGGKGKFTTADIFMDKFIYRSPVYALHFWVEHYDDKFKTNSLVMRVEAKNGNESLIDGRLFCLSRSNKLDECLYITNEKSIIKNDTVVFITLTNTKDEVFSLVY